MARKTILDIENAIGKLEKFAEKTSEATSRLTNMEIALVEGKATQDDVNAAKKDERDAKNREKRARDKLEKSIGDTEQKFKSLAGEIRDFGIEMSQTGRAFDKLLGAQGAEKFAGFFGQIKESEATLVREIDQRKQALKGDNLTAKQSKLAREEISIREFLIKSLRGTADKLTATAKMIENIGTDSAITEVDMDKRRIDRLSITSARDALGPQRIKADGTADERTKGGKAFNELTNSLTGFDAAADAEDAIVGINKKFAMSVDLTKNMVGNFTAMTDQIPIIGGLITAGINKGLEKAVGFAGTQLRENFKASGKEIENNTIKQRIFNFVTNLNPYVAIAAAVLAIGGAILGAITYTRNLGKELGVSVNTARKFSGEIFKASAQLAFFGQDAKAIAGELVDAFGTTERISQNTIVEIGKAATKLGADTKDIISIQKQLMDMTGASADASMELITNIGRIADAEGVGAGNVIADIASNMATFAEFSTMGAQGLAEAAVQAAKVGSSLANVNTFAEKLIDFETSITAEFEAQVLTGKNLNLERARELALQGKMGELSQELQAQVGGLGDLQSMNVVEKRAISAAIGVSVADLQKISRGEAVEQKKTQEDLLSELIEVNKKGFKGNEAAFGKGDSSFNNFMNYGD